MIAYQPEAWLCSSSGGVHGVQLGPGVSDGSLYACSPSNMFQPKLAPLAAATDGSKSTSSHALWPTSPIVSAPVARSNENRHGLRSPSAQTSSAGDPNGLSAGPVPSGFIRSSLPSRGSLVEVAAESFCALWCESPPPPPSPVPA